MLLTLKIAFYSARCMIAISAAKDDMFFIYISLFVIKVLG